MATAIVTGGSQGLGRALTRALHDLGWHVVVDGRHRRALADLVAELGDGAAPVAGPADPAGGGSPADAGPERSGGTAGSEADVLRAPGLTAVVGDVADARHRAALVAEAAAVGDVEVLVNNASTLGPTPMPALADYPLDAWRAVHEVNVVAPLALVQAVLPLLPPGRGRILDITSDAAVEGYAGWGGYGAAKAALEQLGRVLAAEHPEVAVYTVDPGDMRTAMHQTAFPGEDISDRPPPEASVPGLLALILGELPSGRYVARELAAVTPEVPGQETAEVAR